MKKIFVFFLVSYGMFSLLLAQSAEEDVIRLKQSSEITAMDQNSEMDQDKKLPGHWNFSVGTSYSYMKGYGSGMMLYTVPTYTLALNDRWSLHGGVIASHYQGLNYSRTGELQLPGQFSSLAVFAAASYRMTDRLVLHGSGIKQLVDAPPARVMGYPANDISLGATYKLGDNMTIGASVHMRNGSGHYSAPFGSPMFPSTFGW